MNPFYNTHLNGKHGAPEYIPTIFGIVASFMIGSFISVALAQLIGVDMLGNLGGIDSVLRIAFALLPFGFTVLFLWLATKYIHRLNGMSLFTTRSKFDWSRFFLIFGLWFMLNGILLGISFAAGEELIWNFKWDLFIPLFVVAIILIPVQTLGEELVFRSYLFQAMGRIGVTPIISVVFLAVLFASLHGSNPEVQKFGNLMFLFYILNGVFLGLITALDDGIELSYGFHTANNLFGVLIVSFDSSALRTESIFIQPEQDLSVMGTVITFIISATLLFLFFKRRYQWDMSRLINKSN